MAKLSRYAAKRDFSQTPEPGADPSPPGERPRFVIQEHHARRLHWDLRLERDGVLVSWAVPNGIPEDPKRNRKAVPTEDHPLAYLDFEGEIPDGSYGAGTVTLWDRGTYETEKFRPDEVIVNFHGDRIRGRYALFRTRDGDWMIHRMDPPARPVEPMPERIVPMLARAGKLPADEAAWAFEIKWDGIRAVAYYEPGRLRIESRNGNDLTAQYPELRPLAAELGSRTAILDGEIVAFDDDGLPSFERLQQRMHLTSESTIRRRARDVPAVYAIFDLLYIDGRSILRLPYEQRRALLDELGLSGPSWQTPPYHQDDGAGLLAASGERGLEGIVAKRLGSPYEPGRRGANWLKIKNRGRQEVVIGGWLPGEGRRRQRIGALLVGHYDKPRGELRYAGRVGSGFDEAELESLAGRLAPLERPTSPFSTRQPPRGAVYVEPELVAEVEFAEWTREGLLRQPSYKGLREDKSATDVVRERIEEDSAADRRTGYVVVRELKHAIEIEVGGRRLKLSNRDKVIYPEVGFTKGELIDYYAAVAAAMLPHLAGRPVTLKRYPDGVDGKSFYQKHAPAHRPDWLRTVAIRSERERREIDYCVLDDLPSSLWAANLAAIELHTSLSQAARMTRPTAVVFDLDPGPPADLLTCCEVALLVRGLFDELNLQTVVKTSGQKGMQVYVPLNTPTSYEKTKPFAEAVAQLLERQHPELVVSRMAKQLRTGKVFIDWSQNDEHKTTICAYSLRATKRPSVSAPLDWEEVERASADRDRDSLVVDAPRMIERVTELGDLFAPMTSVKQRLPRL